MGKPGRKKADKTAIHFQKYLGLSAQPEEILFKLNEFLFGAEFQALRKNPRIPVNFAVTWKLDEKQEPGRTYTVSRGGMFIKTARPAQPKSEIEIKFRLPGKAAEICARGEVVSVIGMEEAIEKGLVSGMAVVFKEIDPASQHLLDQFIEHKAKKIYTV